MFQNINFNYKKGFRGMNVNHDDIILQIRATWEDITKNHHEPHISEFYDEKSLDSLSQNSNSVIMIMNLKSHKELYVSKNFKTFWGHSHSSNPIIGFLQYIKIVSFKHALFPLIASKWHLKCIKSLTYEEKINQKLVFVGVKINTGLGKTIRTFAQNSYLDVDVERNPINVLQSVQDISHFMKDDFWWMRFSCGENSENVKYYHSSTGKTFEGDIVSDREKDILRLINKGMDSPEIAETLFLSISTIHTHRKNMLARTGMKDVTALLQIALSIGMI
jgi:DNA-binding CsgD family transcriptional regulator